MFWRQPTLNMAKLSNVTAFDPASYQAQLHAKLAELQDLMELNIAEAGCEQKSAYDGTLLPCCSGGRRSRRGYRWLGAGMSGGAYTCGGSHLLGTLSLSFVFVVFWLNTVL